ncbi:hypothetical protein GCM10008908_12140 [Clostridium subterminale]|uniref:Uncharacterized protein n=1 Tax=Clostridium subterminale TaxID=1550 RepID=A0ABP3VUK1_CLOSU
MLWEVCLLVIYFLIRGVEIEANFDRTDMVTIGESIGEKSERDLIPFEGEWFAVGVVESIK